MVHQTWAQPPCTRAIVGDEAPGVDHYCLSVSAFAKDAAKARLAGFDQPYPDWPSNNVWLRDPDGMLIQLAPSANEPQVATIVRNAVAVSRSTDLPAKPPFQAVRISKLVLASTQMASSSDYYHELLGGHRSSEPLRTFGVGPSSLILAPEGTQSFGLAVASFDLPSARSILSSIGLKNEVAADRSTIVLRDPDGIPLTI